MMRLGADSESEQKNKDWHCDSAWLNAACHLKDI